MKTDIREIAMSDKQKCIAKWRDNNACTLNGKPAKVVGWKLDFPVVAELDGPFAVEYSWAAVDRVMSDGGRFVAK